MCYLVICIEKQTFIMVFALQVQAVLLLLGGQELSPEVAGMALGDNANRRVWNIHDDNFFDLAFVFQLIPQSTLSYQLSNDLPRPCNNPQRLASIMRYREKRKNLCFDKKVLYEVRKDVAARYVELHPFHIVTSEFDELIKCGKLAVISCLLPDM